MNNLKHEKKHIITTYESDKNKELRLVSLFNIFQDIADEHAEKLQLGLSYCTENNLAWIGSNYHVKINRMPKLQEEIKIVSWPSAEKRISAIRDFIIYDKNENVLIVAASVWVLLDIIRKRPTSLSSLPEYKIFNEKALETDFTKIPTIEKETFSKNFHVRFDDIDLNNHVNNAIYPLWASESIPSDDRTNLKVKEIKVEFKKEAFYGDEIHVKTYINDNKSFHNIFATPDNREVSKVEIIWESSVS